MRLRLAIPCTELTLLIETLPASLPLVHPLLRTLKRPARMKLQPKPPTMEGVDVPLGTPLDEAHLDVRIASLGILRQVRVLDRVGAEPVRLVGRRALCRRPVQVVHVRAELQVVACRRAQRSHSVGFDLPPLLRLLPQPPEVPLLFRRICQMARIAISAEAAVTAEAAFAAVGRARAVPACGSSRRAAAALAATGFGVALPMTGMATRAFTLVAEGRLKADHVELRILFLLERCELRLAIAVGHQVHGLHVRRQPFLHVGAPLDIGLPKFRELLHVLVRPGLGLGGGHDGGAANWTGPRASKSCRVSALCLCWTVRPSRIFDPFR